MTNGTIVIANDLLGIVVGSQGKHYIIKDKNGNNHVVSKHVVTEIANPHAIALLLYTKIKERLVT